MLTVLFLVSSSCPAAKASCVCLKLHTANLDKFKSLSHFNPTLKSTLQLPHPLRCGRHAHCGSGSGRDARLLWIYIFGSILHYTSVFEDDNHERQRDIHEPRSSQPWLVSDEATMGTHCAFFPREVVLSKTRHSLDILSEGSASEKKDFGIPSLLPMMDLAANDAVSSMSGSAHPVDLQPLHTASPALCCGAEWTVQQRAWRTAVRGVAFAKGASSTGCLCHDLLCNHYISQAPKFSTFGRCLKMLKI